MLLKEHFAKLTLAAMILITSGALLVVAQQTKKEIKLPPVCSDPRAACNQPETADITFALPKKIKPNYTYKAAPFYAVILETATGDAADCGVNGEFFGRAKRRRAQKLFPTRKVFADNQCPDLAAFGYSVKGLPNGTVFLAVYAGETEAEAAQVLSEAQQKFPKASARRVQVTYEEIVQ